MAVLADWNKNGLTVFLEMEIIAGSSPSSGGTAQWIVANSPGGWGSSPVGSLEDGSTSFSFGTDTMRRIMHNNNIWRLNATDGVGWNTITDAGNTFEEATAYATMGEGTSIVTHSQALDGNIVSAGGGWVNFAGGDIRDALDAISAGDRFVFGIASGTATPMSTGRPIYIGAAAINNIWLGDTGIAAIYLGDAEVYRSS